MYNCYVANDNAYSNTWDKYPFSNMNALRLNVHKSNDISEEKTICANGSIDFTIPTVGTFYHL